ncbi:polymeric immunoglobulin receptor-like [Salminus brasiliensis]|uniref:polymeric immunoglobulin receptor-like n=1 Tax=Salminus brasiliensis TaxID=930266 RepID=UPI003B82F2C2
MEIFLIFILFLRSGPGVCFEVIGYPGGSVIIYCAHQLYGQSDKYFCKKSPNKCFQDRVSLLTSDGVLAVTFRELSLEDAGSYQCGETGEWSHTVNLTMTTDPCCLGSKTVTSYLGEPVTIRCSYPKEFETNYKVFFKLDENGDFIDVIQTTDTQIDRFSIFDDRRSKVINVNISDMAEDDGGVYTCGVWNEGKPVSYYSLFLKIHLQIAPKETPTTPNQPAPSPNTTPFISDEGLSVSVSPVVIIVTVGASVVLLLIGGVTLIFYRLRESRGRFTVLQA